MAAYYNEHDPFAAAWLRELIKAGLIADGEVDERSIEDVRPDDLRGFVQCHFFAGIGGWSYALRLAGWPDDRAVWTGSCPCQPFSAAGKGDGFADERHLWPTWYWLIRECRPAVVFGEQVAAAVGHGWLDLVCDDLEGEGYAVGAVCLPGPVSGAFDIRQRLWFVADAQRRTAERRRHDLGAAARGVEGDPSQRQRIRPDARTSIDNGREEAHGEPGTCGEVRELADPESGRLGINGRASGHAGYVDERGEIDGMGHADVTRSQGRSERGHGSDECAARSASLGSEFVGHSEISGSGAFDGQRSASDGRQESAGGSGVSFWSDVTWLPCRDGKARPAQSGIFPLASGLSGRLALGSAVQEPAASFSEEEAARLINRVGALCGAGNAIKPQVAAAFIEAYMSL